MTTRRCSCYVLNEEGGCIWYVLQKERLRQLEVGVDGSESEVRESSRGGVERFREGAEQDG